MSVKIYYLYLSKAPAIVKFPSIDLFTKADQKIPQPLFKY